MEKHSTIFFQNHKDVNKITAEDDSEKIISDDNLVSEEISI